MNEAIEKNEGQLLSEDFGLSAPPETPERTVETVALEIRTLKRQAQGIVLSYAIEIGRRLTEAKAMIPHGEWGAWLKREVEYSQSTAQNLMLVYREYGDEQQSLFGAGLKSQTFGNLTYTKALRLLSIGDEDERERFAAENDVEHMSVRELDEALKARDEAEGRAAAAEDEARALRDELERQESIYEVKLANAGAEADRARTEMQAAEAEHGRLAHELEELRKSSANTGTKAVEAARKAAIEEMTEKVDKARDARMKAEAKRKAAEDALAAAEKELAELRAKEPEIRELTQAEKDALTAEAVERARAEGAGQIRELEKRLAAAEPDVAEFKILFATWQEDYFKMADILKRIAETDEEKAAKLRLAVQAVVEKMT